MFEKIYNQLKKLESDWKETMIRYQKECDEWFAAEFKRQFPKKKQYDFNLIVGRDEMLKPWKENAEKWHKEHSETHKTLNKQLDELARTAEIPKSDEWILHYTSSGYYYSSQTQPEHYAEGDAKRQQSICEMNGVECKRTCERQEISPYLLHKIWIKSTQTGSEILKRKPYSLRDFVKYSWKNGVNPRVSNPFIPYGFEEENGLDYHGNDLKKEENVLS